MREILSDVTSVDEYIASFPPTVRARLKKLRSVIRSVVPEAEERLSYHMPAFKLRGKYVTYFAAWKEHIGVYPMPSAIKQYKKELTGYTTAKGSVQFPLDKPMPYDLIKKLLRARVAEIKKKA